jgi:prevent-host-death family protein
MSKGEMTISVTDFKAKCLDFIERVEKKRITRLVLTRHGKPVATVTGDVPQPMKLTPENWNPFANLGVSVHRPAGLDLSKPIYDPKVDGPFGKPIRRKRRA